MRVVIQVLLSGLIAYLFGGYWPYWGIMVGIAGLALWLKGPAFHSFIGGALGVGLVWLLVPLLTWSASGSDLPDQVAEIMGMQNGLVLAGITAVMGFLIGGTSALTGNLLGKLVQRNKFY
ncbi:hypothetical protein SAMN05192553_104337 [Cyclobacterium xiamenense]|uniref:Uncharacterized protein n=1 Tax=Cyclobacterium xiamenense TaxID=1297121 RepID=A0A1H6ZNG7_9BACT|nr:hypothetical protein [Cyclobacterium xiamenense]SEJ50355.1 hypothetical protein SAMN05192553_104337 [Cyclobacterium xiamenense]